MTAPFEVVTDMATLQISPHGSITGVVAVRCGDFWFPEEGWSDFAIVVVGWWSRAAKGLQSGSPGHFQFMDGSFSFWARPKDAMVTLEFLKGHGQRSVTVAERVAPVASVVDAVGCANREILTACGERGWKSRDIEELRLWGP